MISKRRILAATLAAAMLVCGIPNVTKAIEYNGATSGNSATSGNNASGGNTSSSGNTASDGNTSSSGNVQEKGKPEITFELDDLVIKDEQKGLNYISVDDLDNNSGIKVNVKDDKSNIVQTIIKVNNTEIINITYDEDNQEKSKAYNVKLEKAILKDDKYVINVTSINANNIDTIEEKVIYVESKAPEIINDSIKISGFTEERDNYIIGNKLNVSFDTDSDNNDNQSSIETVEFYLANTNSTDDIKNKSIILKYNNINNSNTTPVTTLNYEMVEKGYYTGYLCAYIKDICGKENYVLLSNKKLLLDNDNPTCTISINNNNYRLLDGKKWIKVQDRESYGYNYEISDNGSGIKEYSIKVNGNEVSNKTENIIETTDDGFNKIINGSFELKDYTPIDGKYEIVIEAADNADNKSEESDDSKDIIYVDENAPYIDGKAEFKNITKEDDSYMYGNKNINISFNVKDDELSSGTDKVEIYEDDEFIDTDNGTTEDIDGLLNDSNRRGNAEITDGVATYTIIAPNPEEAAYEKYVYAKLYDKVGNYRYVALSDKKLIIEQNAPKISIEKEENSFYSNWFNKNVKYEITITDEESGIDVSDYNNKPEDYKIKVNNKPVNLENIGVRKEGNRIVEIKGTYTTDYKIGGVYNYIVSVKARDNAGNDNSNIPEEIGIDTKPPYVINDAEKKTTFKDKNDMEISPIGNEMFTNDDVKVNFYVKDEISGVNNIEIYALDSIIDVHKDSEIEQNKINPADVKISDDEVNVTIKRQDTTLNKYIYAKLTDNAGNSDYVLLSENRLVISSESKSIININGNVIYTDPEENKWIKESTEYAYSIEDKDSGIKSYEIKVNGTTVVDSTKSKDLNDKYDFKKNKVDDVEEKFTLDTETVKPDNGKYIITIDMCDNVGNEVENQKIYEVYYDKTAPEDTKIEGKVAYTDPEGNKWIKESTEYTYSIEDKDSGIKSYEIKVNGTTVVDSTKSEDLNEKYEFTNKKIKKVTEEKFTLNPNKITAKDGKYTIVIDMYDNTGNHKQETYTVYYDKDTPHNTKMKCNSVEDPEGISWIKGSIDYTYSIEDKDSGIKSYEIKVNGTTVVDSKNLGNYDFINKKVKEVTEEKFTLNPNKITAKDGKYTIVIDMYDNTGNHKQETYTVYYDSNTPKLAKIDGKMAYITPSGNKWIKEPISYTYSIEDKDSGIKSYIIKINESTVVDSKDLNNKYNFKGKKVKEVTEEKFTLNPDKIAAKDGKYNIAIDMYDNAGNHKQETYTVYYDSNTPKATKFTMKSDKYVEGNSLPVTDDKYGYYFKHTTKVTVTLADDGTSSGISKVGYFLCKNGEKVSDAIKNKIIVTPTNNEITIQIPEAFRGQIYVAAVDNVGNGDLTKASSYVKPDAIVIDDNRNDKDIITINRPKTAYKDNSGLDLYNKDIPVAFNIKDVTSGIRSIEWEVTSANGEENNYSGRIDIDNSGKINGDNYNVISTDKNLITAISKAIAVRNNDNRITVNIKVEDRAGNISYATDTFSIDKTAPEISISYDNNTPDATNGKMFKSDRKAIISIKERNFNPKNVVIDIKNTDGTVPIISDWSVANGTGNGDNTTYTASLSYVNDGDYTFAMRYQDNADNVANINFVSGTVEPTEFTIDKTRPALSVQFNNNSAVNGNYYLDQRVATFTIIEHNFDASRFELLINRNNATVQQNINWTNNGDTHTASIALDEEALYSIMANYTDMAGNTIENAYNTAFYIDKKAPEVIISGVDNERAYRDNVVGFNISSADTYFESLSISLDLLNKDGSTTNLISNNEEKANVRIDYQNIENGRRLSVANLESDGIYRLVCKASDKAGRVTENNVLFSINRNGPTYYIDDEETLNIKDKYLINPQDIIFNEINVNELSADTIKITVYRGNTTWDLVEGKDYTIEKVEGIDTWCKYRYIISKDNFEENGIYHVTIASKDSVENDAISEKFSFVIDNEPPVCTIFELKKGNVYVADSKDIRFKVTDNIEAESVIVLLNGKEILKLEGDDIKKNMSEDGTLKITIPSSNKSQNLIIKCIDKSGNESETEIKGFYITTNLWIRFINNKPLVIGISCAVVAIIVLIILMIIRKSNKNSTKITEKKTEKNK